MPRQHQVRGLHVAVDDASVVGVREGRAHLHADRDHRCRRHWPATEQLAEVLAIDGFGHEEARLVVGVLAVEDLRDVLVGEAGEHVRLAPKAVHRVTRQVVAEDLDHDPLPERGVLGLIHGRHAASADPTAQQVALAEVGADVVFRRDLWDFLRGPRRPLL
jgi:hypothetical protein